MFLKYEKLLRVPRPAARSAQCGLEGGGYRRASLPACLELARTRPWIHLRTVGLPPDWDNVIASAFREAISLSTRDSFGIPSGLLEVEEFLQSYGRDVLPKLKS